MGDSVTQHDYDELSRKFVRVCHERDALRNELGKYRKHVPLDEIESAAIQAKKLSDRLELIAGNLGLPD